MCSGLPPGTTSQTSSQPCIFGGPDPAAILRSPPRSAQGLPYSGGCLSLGVGPRALGSLGEHWGEPWEDAFEAIALRSAHYAGGACRSGGPFAFIGLSYEGARRLEAATGNRILRPLGCRSKALTSSFRVPAGQASRSPRWAAPVAPRGKIDGPRPVAGNTPIPRPRLIPERHRRARRISPKPSASGEATSRG